MFLASTNPREDGPSVRAYFSIRGGGVGNPVENRRSGNDRGISESGTPLDRGGALVDVRGAFERGYVSLPSLICISQHDFGGKWALPLVVMEGGGREG